MSIFLSRKQKKKIQNKKNKYHQMIFNLVRLRRQEDDRLHDEALTRTKKKRVEDAKSEKEVIWSAKVGKVRNRLTDKKRMSKERWNRFAGTGDEGGRGL